MDCFFFGRRGGGGGHSDEFSIKAENGVSN
jgi:hypothetical protein